MAVCLPLLDSYEKFNTNHTRVEGFNDGLQNAATCKDASAIHMHSNVK